MKRTKFSFYHLNIKIILMIIVVDWALVANSKSFVCGQFTYTTKSDSTVTLAYRGMRNPYIVYGHINIPSVVSDGERDYVVSEISDYAFMRTGITSVSIPGTVKKIGICSFYQTPLTNVEICDGVEIIGIYAFLSCDELQSIQLPESIKEIKSASFSECESLCNVIIPSADIIEMSAFRFCDSLQSVTIGPKVKKIDDIAFAECNNLTRLIIEDGDTPLQNSSTSFRGSHIKELYVGRFNGELSLYLPLQDLETLTFGNKITTIPSYAFEQCEHLTEVVIPDQVKDIKNAAFINCTSLRKITFGDSVQVIGNGAFCGCSNLASLSLPNHLQRIGNESFRDCSSLPELIIPTSVTSIGSNAFAGCSLLTELVIPNNVKTVGNYAFKDCNSLQSIIVEDGSDYLSLNSGTATGEYGGPFIGCPISKVYMGRDICEGNSYFTTYGESPFCAMETLTKLKLGNQVTVIHPYTFAGCTGLKSVVIPDNIQSIRFAAFSGCSGLELIYLGTGLNKIEDSAFSNCSLTTVYNASPIPASITINDTNPFSNYTLDNGILYVPIGTKSAYQSALYWKDFKNIEEFSEFNEELINYVAEYSAIKDVLVDKAQQSNNIGIYTIDGRYLGKRDEISLSPGIYIIDGHKTIVR